MSIPRWLLGVAVLINLVGIVVAAINRQPLFAAVFGAAAAVLALVIYQRRGPQPHTRWAPQQVRPGHAVVFWKDGCPHCHRLLRAMADDDRVSWVNVFRDREGDRKVRELNEGDQFTPTAIVGRKVLRNPSAQELREALNR